MRFWILTNSSLSVCRQKQSQNPGLDLPSDWHSVPAENYRYPESIIPLFIDKQLAHLTSTSVFQILMTQFANTHCSLILPVGELWPKNEVYRDNLGSIKNRDPPPSANRGFSCCMCFRIPLTPGNAPTRCAPVGPVPYGLFLLIFCSVLLCR